MAEPVLPGGDAGSLGRRVGSGLGWSMVNTVVARAATVLVGVVLARLLSPEDYGIYTAALVLVTAALSMNELGVSLAIVRWPGSPASIAPTVTTMAVAWSTALVVVCWVAAPAVATSLGSPDATGVIRALTVCILVDALAAVPAALLTRFFLQKRRFVIDTIGLVVSSSLSIALAALGY